MTDTVYTKQTEIKQKKIKKIFIENLYCKNCNTVMEATGEVICTYPELYKYKCPNCNLIETSHISFPRYNYEYESEDNTIYKIVAIIGKSGAGKDTLLKEIINQYPNEFQEIISCTTRPRRENEIEDINYHYLTNEQFLNNINNNKMLEYTEFRNWYYGTSLDSLSTDKINIGVYNPSGLKLLIKNKNVQVFSIYITSSDKIRLIRQLNREANPDVDEIIRRYQTDTIDFQEIEQVLNQINYCKLNNSNILTLTELANMAYKEIKIFGQNSIINP